MRTYCTCGLRHEFEGADDPPEVIDCNNCPICTGEMEENDIFEEYDFEKAPDEQDEPDD